MKEMVISTSLCEAKQKEKDYQIFIPLKECLGSYHLGYI